MLDVHQAVLTGALRPTESRALSKDPDGKGRSNRSPSVWMQYVDPPLGTLRQTSYRTPPGLASYHRSAAQAIRPPDDLVNARCAQGIRGERHPRLGDLHRARSLEDCDGNGCGVRS